MIKYSVFIYSLTIPIFIFWLGVMIRIMATGTIFDLDKRKWTRFFVRNTGRLIGYFGAFSFVALLLNTQTSDLLARTPLIWVMLSLAGVVALGLMVISLFDSDLRKRLVTLSACGAMFILAWYFAILSLIEIFKTLF